MRLCSQLEGAGQLRSIVQPRFSKNGLRPKKIWVVLRMNTHRPHAGTQLAKIQTVKVQWKALPVHAGLRWLHWQMFSPEVQVSCHQVAAKSFSLFQEVQDPQDPERGLQALPKHTFLDKPRVPHLVVANVQTYSHVFEGAHLDRSGCRWCRIRRDLEESLSSSGICAALSLGTQLVHYGLSAGSIVQL